MAEGLFRYASRDAEEEITVASAGTGASDGLPPSTHSIEVMKEEKIDISGQTSQFITPDLIEEVTHIFGMTRGHAETIRIYFPESREKTFVLREFLGHGDLDLDVPDPIGMDVEEYRRVRNLIKEAIPSVLKFVAEGEIDSD